jgi:hypothetical protein
LNLGLQNMKQECKPLDHRVRQYMMIVTHETAVLHITVHDYNNAENINLTQLCTNNFQAPDIMKSLSVRFIYNTLTIVSYQYNQRHLYFIRTLNIGYVGMILFLFKIVWIIVIWL